MTNHIIYLICGVPGSGKTWVCEQLRHKFNYVVHDDHIKDVVGAILRSAANSNVPTITECPFAERELRAKLVMHGFQVNPVFIVEEPEIVRSRYIGREGREPHRGALTRASSIGDRAREWNAPHGTSTEMLDYLLKEKS
jgi:hypothetical protein